MAVNEKGGDLLSVPLSRASFTGEYSSELGELNQCL